IIIGNDVSINFDCHIACVNKISIGNNVLMASKVFITDHFHGNASKASIALPPSKRVVESKGPVIIEDNVWVGEGVAIMPNVTIGQNSIIGANAVVTKSFPANSVIAGNPAKLIKTII
ncbi:MAG: acyltransferase, partial [Pedobacter sp.]